MSKTEEKLKTSIKEYMKEYTEEKNKEISSNIITIFLWGFGFGMVFSYANITPLMIGIILGYFLGKKNISFIDYYITKFVSLIDLKKVNELYEKKNDKENIK